MAKRIVCRKVRVPFYRQPAEVLAPALIGKILVRRVGGVEYRARIVETEGYVGPDDLACHSSKGCTPRTQVMFGPPGRAYVYLIYGMHDMFNIVSGPPGGGQAVLVRAAEPLGDWPVEAAGKEMCRLEAGTTRSDAAGGVWVPSLSGPGRLARAMRITRADNGLDLTGESLFLLDDGGRATRIVRAPRVGVDYAKEWKDVLLRFYDPASRAVSKPRPNQ